MKTIDLKKIYEDKFFETVCKHTPGPNPGSLPHCSKESIRIHMNSPAADAALIAMKEACKQVLELAVENVMEVEFIETGPMDESVLESITNTINQVKWYK